jgi:hypothetical protein
MRCILYFAKPSTYLIESLMWTTGFLSYQHMACCTSCPPWFGQCAWIVLSKESITHRTQSKNRCVLEVLPIKIYLAESDLIQKAFIKGRSAKIFADARFLIVKLRMMVWGGAVTFKWLMQDTCQIRWKSPYLSIKYSPFKLNHFQPDPFLWTESGTATKRSITQRLCHLT